MFDSIDSTVEELSRLSYIADKGLATSLFLALRMERALFLEGEPGVGKTEVAKVDDALLDLARVRDTLREAAAGLQSAAAKLKRAKQEQRTADKEIRSVRSTLESLRKVRL